jgi:hypothetical protein
MSSVLSWGHILEFSFQDSFGYAVSEAAVVCFVKKLQRQSSSSDPINFSNSVPTVESAAEVVELFNVYPGILSPSMLGCLQAT